MTPPRRAVAGTAGLRRPRGQPTVSHASAVRPFRLCLRVLGDFSAPPADRSVYSLIFSAPRGLRASADRPTLGAGGRRCPRGQTCDRRREERRAGRDFDRGTAGAGPATAPRNRPTPGAGGRHHPRGRPSRLFFRPVLQTSFESKTTGAGGRHHPRGRPSRSFFKPPSNRKQRPTAGAGGRHRPRGRGRGDPGQHPRPAHRGGRAGHPRPAHCRQGRPVGALVTAGGGGAKIIIYIYIYIYRRICGKRARGTGRCAVRFRAPPALALGACGAPRRAEGVEAEGSMWLRPPTPSHKSSA